MRSAGVLTLAALAQLGLASNHHGHHEHLHKRQGGTFAISGVTADGQIGVRQELRTLAQDADAYNLFVLAMQDFQNTDTNDRLSYYQIAAIHGLPAQTWDGVEANQDAINQGGGGYCFHTTPIFLPWHRPYVALYEQAWYNSVQKVVSQFQGADHDRYAAKAAGLRLPYYDWALPATPAIPSQMTDPSVTVNGPAGQSQIPNPLYSYKMQILNQADTGGDPWINYQNTLRYPTTGDSSASSDEQTMINNLNNGQAGMTSGTYNMLLNCTGWEEFGDDGAQTSSPGCTNLEGLHDNMHVAIGGGGQGGAGHMTNLAIAGFDVAFFMHHNNVDRLLALWQAVHPDVWVSPGQTTGPTYTTTTGTAVDADFPLYPFHSDESGNFWTANAARDHTVFHYTFPELANGATQQDVIASINKLYGTTQPQQNNGNANIQASSSSAAPTSAPTSGATTLPNRAGTASSSGLLSGATGIIPNPDLNGVANAISSGAGAMATDANGLASEASGAIGAAASGASGALASGASGIASAIGGMVSGVAGGASGAAAGASGAAAGVSGFPGANGFSNSSSGLGSLGSSIMQLPSDLADLLTPTGKLMDWNVKIVTERMGLGGSYVIYVFFGDVPEDSSTWGTACVGSHGVFSSPHMGTASGTLVSGTVNILPALVGQIQAGNLMSLDALIVNPFLKTNMQWRVKKSSGEVVSNNNVPGLAVGVANNKVIPATSPNTFPTYQAPMIQTNVTSGKPGGLHTGMTYDWWNSCGSSM